MGATSFIRRLGLANDDIKLGNSTQGQSEIRRLTM